MICSINRFWGEQHPRHKGKLVWNDHFLFPVRLKNSSEFRLIDNVDLNEHLYVSGDSWVAVFDLSKKEDLEHFNWVKERAVNGWFRIIHEEHHWDQKQKKMIVYLEWVQYYSQFKPRKDYYGPETPKRIYD